MKDFSKMLSFPVSFTCGSSDEHNRWVYLSLFRLSVCDFTPFFLALINCISSIKMRPTKKTDKINSSRLKETVEGERQRAK